MCSPELPGSEKDTVNSGQTVTKWAGNSDSAPSNMAHQGTLQRMFYKTPDFARKRQEIWSKEMLAQGRL